MKLVAIESPYAGDVETNLEYLRTAMKDCLFRGEAPFASHALYTQRGVLLDHIPAERELGIRAGLVWAIRADNRIFYTDLGWSQGMLAARERYDIHKLPYETRTLKDWKSNGIT